MKDGTFQLEDGRQLRYAEHGDPHGIPVFFFHGTPGSRRMRHPNESIATSRNLRIFTVDRPGFGLSDSKPNRTFLDWPTDFQQLTDHLAIEKCSILAFSGGGPYTLACAYQLPELVKSVTLLDSVGPLSAWSRKRWNWPIHLTFSAADRAPWLLQTVTKFVVRKGRANFDAYVKWAARKLPKCDRDILLQSEIKSIFEESLIQAFHQGPAAFVQEVRLMTKPWNFSLQEVRQPVSLWHGEQDRFHEGHTLAEALPNCSPHFFPQEGHLLFFNHWDEILDELLIRCERG